jgi:hypothetical protein
MIANIIRNAKKTTGPIGPTVWTLTVQTTAINQAFGMNIQNGTTYSVTIDWGDGSSPQVFTTSGIKTVTYAAIGTYTVLITGTGSCNMAVATTNPSRLIATSAIPRTLAAGGASCFSSTFLNCTSLTTIPENLFWYSATPLTTNAFQSTFRGCTGLTSIPADLFRYNTGMTSGAFQQAFYGCTGLTSIPADLFRYNTGMTSGAFQSTFRGCTGLTSIPTGLFQYNTGVTTTAFQSTFRGCTGLNGYAVQADLLRYNILMSGTSTALDMFFTVTLNTVAYSNLLISLNTYLTASNLGFGGGSSKYDTSATTARAALVARGWFILDGGAA